MNIVSKSLLVVLCISLLASCGFHLRDSVKLSDEIAPIFMKKGGNRELRNELRTLLSESGSNILASSKREARAVLDIISTKKKRRVVAVDRIGRARQYELSYIIRYSVTGENIPKVEDDNINMMHLRRVVVFDPDNVLAIGHEVERLYSDMRKNAARLILQRLQALDLKLSAE